MVVGRVVKVAVMEETRAVPVAALYRNEEALKTESHDCPLIFHRSPLQKHPKGKHRSIKNKKRKEPNILLPIDFSTYFPLAMIHFFVLILSVPFIDSHELTARNDMAFHGFFQILFG